jgi:hypothetical protein
VQMSCTVARPRRCIGHDQCVDARPNGVCSNGTVRSGLLFIEIKMKSLVLQWFTESVVTIGGVDRSDVLELAEELSRLTYPHLPWSDQRVIKLELGVGQVDLAIEDMVRGAADGSRALPADVIARLYEWLDGYDLPAGIDVTRLRVYVSRLRCA